MNLLYHGFTCTIGATNAGSEEMGKGIGSVGRGERGIGCGVAMGEPGECTRKCKGTTTKWQHETHARRASQPCVVSPRPSRLSDHLWTIFIINITNYFILFTVVYWNVFYFFIFLFKKKTHKVNENNPFVTCMDTCFMVLCETITNEKGLMSKAHAQVQKELKSVGTVWAGRCGMWSFSNFNTTKTNSTFTCTYASKCWNTFASFH